MSGRPVSKKQARRLCRIEAVGLALSRYIAAIPGGTHVLVRDLATVTVDALDHFDNLVRNQPKPGAAEPARLVERDVLRQNATSWIEPARVESYGPPGEVFGAAHSIAYGDEFPDLQPSPLRPKTEEAEQSKPSVFDFDAIRKRI
jgi:hypothetical protein